MASIFAFAEGFTADVSTTAVSIALPGASGAVTIPAGHTGNIVATFSAESACYDGTSGCTIVTEIDGTPSDAGDFAFDSNDGGTEGSGS